MNVNVKNPTKPYSAPPYIQIKTDKRVQFSRVCYKNLVHRLWSTENLVCSERQREGKSHFFTLGSEVRDYHKVKQTFWVKGGVTIEQNMLIKNGMQSIFGVFICQWICWACMGLCRYMGRGFSRAEKGTNLHCERLLLHSFVVFFLTTLSRECWFQSWVKTDQTHTGSGGWTCFTWRNQKGSDYNNWYELFKG